MTNRGAAHIVVSGKVQGVGYRNFTQDRAAEIRLTGWVRNLPDGRVEIKVEGEKADIEALIQSLWKGPLRSKVTGVEVAWERPSSQFTDFSVVF